jgi:hypothetical protein
VDLPRRDRIFKKLGMTLWFVIIKRNCEVLCYESSQLNPNYIIELYFAKEFVI